MKNIPLIIILLFVIGCNFNGGKSNKNSQSKNEINISDSNPPEDEVYGIDKESAHKRAIELAPESFFWDGIDELAPFGSDEGDTALSEFRNWRKTFPNKPTIECLKWTIESVGEIKFEEYNEGITSEEIIKSQIEDEQFDDRQYIYTLDISVIATGFGQLVDEGIIDSQNKSIIRLALNRQKKWAELLTDWEHRKEYISNLIILERILDSA
ncbi:hypothetical protein [uncultured Maribacter sp.]|uniref:hypothetical protein n=1 Tax=uncultured Maribacter sp. TaxID=431308 RepID=UPI002612CDFA|nr:hypothetical protein [uncultured Maribacter sp.]